ncbi:hypothetical protein [Polaromonas sp. YR568]|uniref:hypothetical protein n=1 Tax=Polaromonas sp. YR568 TaxID=1855301 RepID=UPI0020C8F372|nr:hypothetical protein [Polaromonas sp. YR568]
MDSGLDLVGTGGAFFRGKSGGADFTVFAEALLTGALDLLALADETDMACFPGFSTLALFVALLAAGLAEGFTPALATGFAAGLAALTGGLPAGRAAALGAALAFGFAAALDCALCGFLDVLGFIGLAVGMGPPVVGNCFKYRSATSKQKCALAPAQSTGTVTRIQGQKNGKDEKQARQRQWSNGVIAPMASYGIQRFSFSGKLFGRTFGVQSLRKFLGGIGRLIC